MCGRKLPSLSFAVHRGIFDLHLTIVSPFLMHFFLLILYISYHRTCFLFGTTSTAAAHRIVTRDDQTGATVQCQQRRMKKEKKAKIFRNGMGKRPKKVVSARNCFPFKVDHKTYVDKLSWVSAAMLNVCCVCSLFFLLSCMGYWLCVYCSKLQKKKVLTSYVTASSSFLLSFFSLRSLPLSFILFCLVRLHMQFSIFRFLCSFVFLANNNRKMPQ